MKRTLILSLFSMVALVSLFLLDACARGAPSQKEAIEWDPNGVLAGYVESTDNPEVTAYIHAQNELVCTDCHGSDELRQLYREYDPIAINRANNAMTGSTRKLCLSCHGSEPDLLKLTAASTVYGEGVNPHGVHVQDDDCCALCHKMHKEQSYDVENCYTCHHTRTLKNCAECHGAE